MLTHPSPTLKARCVHTGSQRFSCPILHSVGLVLQALACSTRLFAIIPGKDVHAVRVGGYPPLVIERQDRLVEPQIGLEIGLRVGNPVFAVQHFAQPGHELRLLGQ